MFKPHLIIGAGAILAAAAPAIAHHSFAMFDVSHTETLNGTIKDLDWVNPHSWLDVTAADQGGNIVTWGFETGGPSELYKAGWRRSKFHPGDKITVVFHPLRDGKSDGGIIAVTLADGTQLSTTPKRPGG